MHSLTEMGEQRGIGLLELVLAVTIGSIALVAFASAWGSIALWMNRLQSQALLVREAKLAREYLQADLLAAVVVPPADSRVLVLIIDGDPVSYGLREQGLWRETPDGREVLVATYVDHVEFFADVPGGRVVATLEFDTGGTRLDLTLEVRGQEPEALFGEA